jgi:hypothetical protein
VLREFIGRRRAIDLHDLLGDSLEVAAVGDERVVQLRYWSVESPESLARRFR